MEAGRGLDITFREDHRAVRPDHVECFFSETGVSAGFGPLNSPMRGYRKVRHLFRLLEIGFFFTDFLRLAEVAGVT